MLVLITIVLPSNKLGDIVFGLIREVGMFIIEKSILRFVHVLRYGQYARKQ